MRVSGSDAWQDSGGDKALIKSYTFIGYSGDGLWPREQVYTNSTEKIARCNATMKYMAGVLAMLSRKPRRD